MKAISLFSGAGGDTLGMIDSGIDVVGFVEMEKNAIETHLANFPESKLIGKDITKIPDETFEEFEGEIDVIFGGFPCQSFSHGGKKDATDKRGFLYQEFVRCAKIIKPKVIIGENVKGILSRKDSDKSLIFDKILEEFEEAGYNMKYCLFNLKDYGIPQDRQRVIIYGTRKDLDIDLDISDLEKDDRKAFNKDILKFSLERALKIEKDTILSLIPENQFLKGKGAVSLEPPTNLKKCYERDELSFKKRSKPTYGCIIDRNDVSRTILSTYGRMPRLFVPVKCGKDAYLRPYTVRELQLIQGFPENFVFKGNYLQQITQIGNAISPVFVKKVMDHIQSQL